MMTYVLQRPRRSPLAAIQSTFIHLSLVAGVLWATGRISDAAADPGVRPIDLTWTPISTTATSASGTGLPALPRIVSTVPTTLPPIDLVPVRSVPVDPRTLVGALLPGLGTDTAGIGVASASTIYQEREVDDLPVLRSAPALRYPRAMAEAGIDGSVTLAFVIDSAGHVVAGSAQVVRATHPVFVAAAEEAVYGSLFQPARRRGEGVPVRVHQTVTFRH